MIVTCQQMQQCEEAAFTHGVSAAALMEEAGKGIAQVVRQFAPRAGSLVLFLGKGNNAGDALVAARELVADGWKLHARLCCEPAAMKELPRRHLALLGSLVHFLEDATTFDFPAGPLVSLDGLLGIGATGPMKPELQALAREMNTLRTQRHALTIAMDIPSGLDGDHGDACDDAVEADVTAVVAHIKSGLLEDGADHYVGRIALVPLPALSQITGDASAEALTPRLLRHWLPRRANDMHKGDAGRVGILAGSPGFLGAAELACRGAIRGGAGLVTLLVKEDVYLLMAPRMPAEVMVKPIDDYRDVLEMRFDSLALGPGLGFAHEKEILEVLKRSKTPAVVDADALTMLAQHPDVLDAMGKLPRLLTPHPGEMDRLLRNFPGWHGMSRRTLVESLTETNTGHTLLLKGTRTVIATRGQPTLFNTTGHAGMASGGMGDVLTGVCAALAAQHIPLHQAAGLGAWLCGRAAERFVIQEGAAMEAVGATDVTSHLGGALQDLKDGLI
ncbi:NAD(P)H-hydrate dehydratase [Prosthecobacter sp.]|uniref:NAD(P)H-hydrate dehydratase n=1 Tax=Prosthecobacter sp. TaxID=1965333 RepID=UPI00378358BC